MELEKHRRYFTKVLKFSKKDMVVVRKQWEDISILVHSIGWRVPSEWVAKEFKDRGKLAYDPKAFALVENHHLIRFKVAVDCKTVLNGGPWFTIRQLLVVGPWVPDFVPGVKQVR